ncbi:MAG: PLDc_N domain-containing protein [Verrucomicrobia bacterium]|nr:PLDc_N domain-containing protein [Verrucomicrobiota bacterium]
MFGLFGIIEIFALLFFLPLCLLGTIFWIWMLVDCATKESNQSNDKIVWILIIVFTHFIGALIYFFVRRSRRV